MNVTQDVILDLLPLYFSAEASADSRRLVDEYFAEHPSFAVKARESAAESGGGALPPDRVELRGLLEAKRRVRQRSYLMGAAIFFTIAPLSFVYHDGAFFFMMRESPVSAVAYGAVGLLLWIVYAVIRWKNRVIGI